MNWKETLEKGKKDGGLLRWILVFWIALGFFSTGCDRDRKVQFDTGIDGYQRMQDSIDAIDSRIDVEVAIYENDRRSKLFEEQLQKNPSPVLAFQVAREKLNMGDTDAAIEMIERIFLAIPETEGLGPRSKMLHEFLGICYLRKSEQLNCQVNHTAESCIVPLQDGGVHIQQEPAEKALEKYREILAQFPEDDQSKWLYNVAAMALGRHPKAVEMQHRVELPLRNTELHWKNIATPLGVDANGLSGGVIADDFNNDGLLDLIVSAWGFEGSIRYFEQTEEGFVDKTEESNLSHAVGGLNLKQGDFDNDGNLDFFILRGAWRANPEWGIMPNSLIRNNGDGTFSDVTFEAGVYSARPTQSAAWTDYDLDGALDLVVANETVPKSREGFPCEFFRNQGDGTFVEEAKELETDFTGYFKAVCAGDIDDDGRPDLFFSNLDGANVLLQNEQAEGGVRWQNIAAQAGVLAPESAFPAWFMDFDQDGREDLYVATFDSTAFINQSAQFAMEMTGRQPRNEPNALYRNLGKGQFEDRAADLFEVQALSTMGCNFGDVNNDGYPDFYLGTGAPDYRAIVPNRMFVNEKGRKYRETTFDWGLGHIQKGHGIAFADWNENGKQDIYAVMGGAFQGDEFMNAMYRNPLSDIGNFVKIRLKGITSNIRGIGAKIKVSGITAGGEKVERWKRMQTGASFGANPTRLHIGLGDVEEIVEVIVWWPTTGDREQRYSGLEINRQYILSEDGSVESVPLQPVKYEQWKSHSGHHQH